ncbi:hypothetical protein [Alkalimarinus alittae]|uniref:Uncharacterized protein n=1 Tax=Alkalimarinus alittae TaxID=2961619 RepID=A0ABY6MYE8_9ALTE|nr:hypothetical protein [Alkalimarinus alittae]UZE94802.1 hypothetical protein NKI27_12010 [Alkalimarinus alittae]
MASTKYKISISIAALIIVILTFTGWCDNKGSEYAAEQIEIAAITFAVARSLNAGISIAQGTEVTLSPAGVGTTLTVGEVLDPINDMIERFSLVVLAAITSLGIQQILISIASTTLINLLVVLSTLTGLVLILKPQLAPQGVRIVAYKTCLLLIVFRFFIALSLLLNQAVYINIIESNQSESLASLKISAEEIKASPSIQVKTDDQERSFLNDMKNKWDNFQESMSNTLDLEKLKDKASNAVDNMTDLIISFVLLTLLMPIAFLWLGIKLVGYIITYKIITYKPNDNS